MHKIRIIANWKSNKSVAQAEQWLSEFKHQWSSRQQSAQVEAIIAPPTPALALVADELYEVAQASVAVQDISQFPAGSYTGAVSAANLADLSVRYAIVGHSERRKYFHETHSDVAGKVAQAWDANITPVVCVDAEYLQQQAAAIAPDLLEKCIVAYEPLSAIGTGNNAPVDVVKRVVADVKTTFGDIPVLYGGSVTAENIAEYLLVTDGALVGGASLDVESFLRLLGAVSTT